MNLVKVGNVCTKNSKNGGVCPKGNVNFEKKVVSKNAVMNK